MLGWEDSGLYKSQIRTFYKKGPARDGDIFEKFRTISLPPLLRIGASYPPRSPGNLVLIHIGMN